MRKVHVIITGCRWVIASLMMTPIIMNILNGSLRLSPRPYQAPQVVQLSSFFAEAQFESDLLLYLSDSVSIRPCIVKSMCTRTSKYDRPTTIALLSLPLVEMSMLFDFVS